MQSKYLPKTTIFLILITVGFSILAGKIAPDKMFTLDSIPIIVAEVKSEHWQTLIDNYSNSTKVPLENIKIYPMKNGKQDGEALIISGGKIGVKGNAGRVSPEESPHKKSFGKFYQANYSLFFDENINGYEKVNLRFFKADWNHCRNIYTFKIIRDMLERAGCDKLGEEGYTTCPFASYVHLYIAIKGDNDPGNMFNPLDTSMKSDPEYHAYDFGLYELTEDNIGEGFLKSRFGKKNKDHGRYLWKCAMTGQVQYFSVPGGDWPGYPVNANLFIDTDKDPESIHPYSKTWFENSFHEASVDPKPGVIFGIKSTLDGNDYKPSYSFAGKKGSFNDALKLLAGFIYNLNMLPVNSESGEKVSALEGWISNGFTKSDWKNPYSDEINSYKFDYKSFLVTLAVQQAVGAWDNYLNNSNNYCLYFDNMDKIVYMLPYDIKLTFGVMLHPPHNSGAMGLQNLYNESYVTQKRKIADPAPISSEEAFKRHSLVSRLLKVPSYMDFYNQQLTAVSEYLKDEQHDHFSNSVGKWYRLIYNNFYQGHLGESGYPGFDPDYKQVISESNNPLDYIYHTTGTPAQRNYIQVPDNTAADEGSNMNLQQIRDSSNVSWTDSNSRNLVMFVDAPPCTGNRYDGNEYNFISTSINNIVKQVKPKLLKENHDLPHTGTYGKQL